MLTRNGYSRILRYGKAVSFRNGALPPARGKARTNIEESTMNNGSRHVGFDSLKCPHCRATFQVSTAIAAHVAEQAQIEFSAREAQIVQRTARLEHEVTERVEAALLRRVAEAENKARNSVSLELADLKRQINEKNEQVQSVELALQAERRDRIKAVGLEVGRRVDAERQKIEATVADQFRLQIADKEKALHDVRKVNEALTRKLQQGSQQSQGEVLERELEAILKSAFPTDQLEPVRKGVKGADVIHRVVSKSGVVCGTIVWEVKRTKSWGPSWLQKLKDDQRSVKAELAVIVSEALPPGCRDCEQLSGAVWVTNPQCAVILARALRQNLTDVALVRMAAEGKHEKSEVLYEYLTGPEFKQRVEVMFETFREMQTDLQEERRAADRRWAKREKQLHRIASSVEGMYGELQGVLGSSMAMIPSLESTPDENSDASAEALASPATSASQESPAQKIGASQSENCKADFSVVQPDVSAWSLNAQFGIFDTVGIGSKRASDDAWYYAVNGGNVGPLTLEGLLEALAAFSNAKDIGVWCARFPNWKRAEDVPELKAKLERINPGPMGGGNGFFRH
jgi:hypothetical protein